MLNLYRKVIPYKNSRPVLLKEEISSLYYHNLFDYPLNFQELVRWKLSKNISNKKQSQNVIYRDGYFFLEGKDGIIYKRLLRERISKKKVKIAIKASKVLSLIPWVLMVAVTGSLAMNNASDESDIDLMIITKNKRLWTTRLLSYLILKIFKIKTRRSKDLNQKDKLCLNIWLDESDLKWKKNKNIYTAHEIAQIKPIFNKLNTYEKFLYENRWILKYWPNSVRITKVDKRTEEKKYKLQPLDFLVAFIEKIVYKLQYQYMKPKITSEVISPTKALFHPYDWGKFVLSHFSP